MSEIPKEWQKISRWEAHVAWLKNQPSNIPMRAANDDLDDESLDEKNFAEQGLASGEKVEPTHKRQDRTYQYPEDKLHQGWWHYRGITRPELYTDYADALDHITKVLKHPDMGELAGLHFSKSQRKAHIQAFHGKFAEPFFVDEERDLLWEYGDWALKASLAYSSFRDPIECDFEEAINPVRSLEGLRVRMERRSYGAKPDLVVEGVVHIEDNTLQVDQWSHTFDANHWVEGRAYAPYGPSAEGIFVYDDRQGISYTFYGPPEEPQ